MKSKKLESFINEISYSNRNPKKNDVLDLLNDDATNPKTTFEKGKDLYRCRTIAEGSILNGESPFWGFDAKGSFVPNPENTRDMRANYRYIPYLYCATHHYIAVCEMRTRVGARLNLARIVPTEDLKMFDLAKIDAVEMPGAKRDIIGDLCELFAKPVTEEDDIKDYIPTQYIAEYIKNLGYDGLVYRSSVTKEFVEQKGAFEMLRTEPDFYNQLSNWNNAVIFNYDKCEVKESNIVVISGNYYSYQQDDDSKKKEYSYNPFKHGLVAATFHPEIFDN